MYSCFCVFFRIDATSNESAFVDFAKNELALHVTLKGIILELKKNDIKVQYKKGMHVDGNVTIEENSFDSEKKFIINHCHNHPNPNYSCNLLEADIFGLCV